MKTISKKKKKSKSPTEHGFMDECIEKNKDKGDSGAYCASIVDRAKGTTDWRKGPRKSSRDNWYKKAQRVINRSRSVYNPEEGVMVDLDELDIKELEDLQMDVVEPEDIELIRLEIINREVSAAELHRDMEEEKKLFGKKAGRMIEDPREYSYYPSYIKEDHTKMVLINTGTGEEWPARYDVCPVCQGRGAYLNPAIDSRGISSEEFAEDPEFAEDYMSGVHDILCKTCKGNRVILVPSTEEGKRAIEEAIREEAQYRAEVAMERSMGA